jgi:hypothetical protein
MTTAVVLLVSAIAVGTGLGQGHARRCRPNSPPITSEAGTSAGLLVAIRDAHGSIVRLVESFDQAISGTRRCATASELSDVERSPRRRRVHPYTWSIPARQIARV